MPGVSSSPPAPDPVPCDWSSAWMVSSRFPMLYVRSNARQDVASRKNVRRNMWCAGMVLVYKRRDPGSQHGNLG